MTGGPGSQPAIRGAPAQRPGSAASGGVSPTPRRGRSLSSGALWLVGTPETVVLRDRCPLFFLYSRTSATQARGKLAPAAAAPETRGGLARDSAGQGLGAFRLANRGLLCDRIVQPRFLPNAHGTLSRGTLLCWKAAFSSCLCYVVPLLYGHPFSAQTVWRR